MFDLYASLGDSMSIDYYAGTGLGAASLLHRNDDLLWPEFAGHDLVSLNPACELRKRGEIGAAIRQVTNVVSRLEAHSGPTLVTLTVGGNDLLSGLGSKAWPVEGFERDLGAVLQQLARALPPDLLRHRAHQAGVLRNQKAVVECAHQKGPRN